MWFFVVFIKVKILKPICHLKSQWSHFTLLTPESSRFLQFTQSCIHILFPLQRIRWAQLRHSETLESPSLILIHFQSPWLVCWILTVSSWCRKQATWAHFWSFGTEHPPFNTKLPETEHKEEREASKKKKISFCCFTPAFSFTKELCCTHRVPTILNLGSLYPTSVQNNNFLRKR